MSGWWAFALSVGIGVILGAAQAVHDHWFTDGWVERANAAAAEKGLPEATHIRRKWGRPVGVMAVDENGRWLWKAERP